MPADAFFPIKDMKAIEVRFGSNNDSRNDSTGVMAGYATYIKGTVNEKGKCTHVSQLLPFRHIAITADRSYNSFT